ncbi:MAG TPA: D-alanyl-D-alanine endopeptidase [Steroidobacteraceae bacterium]|jgi:D-alanyl-D-alanine endopeptidase (penicillin-binding protein 7)|nr:D-alanyl-D-alanine endopeptidase [Steroidobacteraceae bacterium]
MHRREQWGWVRHGFLAALVFGFGLTANAADSKAALAGPAIRSAAALVVDAKTGEVLFERDAGVVTPIASVTKLMTALVVLEGQQPLDEVIEIKAADRWKGKGAFSHLPTGAKLSRADLLRLALMASENLAARTLARNYPGAMTAFVRTMNVKAKALGMAHTRFDDPSGLSSSNVSSARDLVKLVNAASREPMIGEFSTLRSHEVRLGKKMFVYRNTNLLIGRPDWTIAVQKTGFTNDAGQCLVMQAVVDDRVVDMVFLNSFGKLTRTADARRIRRWMEAQSAPSVASAGAAAP